MVSAEVLRTATVSALAAVITTAPGQGEDQIQPAMNDRVNRTLTSGPLSDLPAEHTEYFFQLQYQRSESAIPAARVRPGLYGSREVLQYSASIQQQLPSNAVLTIAYVGSQGRNLFLRRITNLITGVTMDPVTGVATAVRQFTNQYAEIDLKTSGGTDHYDALQLSLNRRFSRA